VHVADTGLVIRRRCGPAAVPAVQAATKDEKGSRVGVAVVSRPQPAEVVRPRGSRWARRSNLRSGSATITDHTLAAPVVFALPSIQLAKAGSPASCGIGSQRQRRTPVRASNARTSPSGVVRYSVPSTTSGVVSKGGSFAVSMSR